MSNNISNEKVPNATIEHFTENGYSADEAAKLAEVADIYKEYGKTIDGNSTPKNAKKRKRRNKYGYAVSDEILLYRIADLGLLSKLHGVQAGVIPRVFYFDKDPVIKATIDEYKANPDKKSNYIPNSVAQDSDAVGTIR